MCMIAALCARCLRWMTRCPVRLRARRQHLVLYRQDLYTRPRVMTGACFRPLIINLSRTGRPCLPDIVQLLGVKSVATSVILRFRHQLPRIPQLWFVRRRFFLSRRWVDVALSSRANRDLVTWALRDLLPTPSTFSRTQGGKMAVKRRLKDRMNAMSAARHRMNGRAAQSVTGGVSQ